MTYFSRSFGNNSMYLYHNLITMASSLKTDVRRPKQTDIWDSCNPSATYIAVPLTVFVPHLAILCTVE